jgi:hypothetical protein
MHAIVEKKKREREESEANKITFANECLNLNPLEGKVNSSCRVIAIDTENPFS